MKRVRYTEDALRDLRRHANMAERVRRVVHEFAAGQGAHANRVKALKGRDELRMRVGDFRIVFEEGLDEIVVTKVAPRGGVYHSDKGVPCRHFRRPPVNG